MPQKRLVSIPQWCERHFVEGSAPSDVTVRRALRDGKLPGMKVAGTWYVDEAEWLADGDELVRRVLSGAN